MPSEGRRLHPFTVLSRALRIARQLLLPAIVGGVSTGGGIERTLTWITLILAVPSIVVAAAQWMAFRFHLHDDELILDSGVLSRRRRVIPLGRIQNVDLEQTALERLVGVAQLRLETASAGRDTEAGLEVLSLGEARELREELLRRRAAHRAGGGTAAAVEGDAAGEGRGADTGFPRPPADADTGAAAPGAVSPPRVLLRLSTADLAIAGATSNEAGLIAAGLATLLQFADDFGGLRQVDRWLETVFTRGMEVGLAGAMAAIAMLAIFFIVAGWLVSIVATVVRFHGFTLTREGDDLRREYGLLSRHHSTIPLERIQAVRIEETLLRRPLKLAALKIETAGAGPQQRGEAGGGAEAFVPIARRRDVGRLLREVFEDARFEGTHMHPVAPVSRRRSFLRLAWPVVLLTAGLATLASPDWLWLLLLLAPAGLLANAQYRARAWSRPAGFALARTGVMTRLTWVVPVRKIQTLHSLETPFQRRLGIATLLIDTAAGGRVARVVDLEQDTALGLLTELTREGDAIRRAALAGERRTERRTTERRTVH